MNRFQALSAFMFVAITTASVSALAKNPQVVFETNQGNFVVELDQEKAPLSTKNMLSYVEKGFYDGTIFHRVIPSFMIQGGGFTKDMAQKPTAAAIKNEASNGLKNKRGTVAMARTGEVDSATAQFFINVKDNDFLDHTSKEPSGFGYAVFGKVIEGMDVVDKIEHTKTLCPSRERTACTAKLPPGMQDVPADAVVIVKAKLRTVPRSEEKPLKN